LKNTKNMNAEALTDTHMQPAVSPREASPRLAREWQTIEVMVHIYCRDHHHHHGELCPECKGLIEYASMRLDRCRFGPEKPTCAKCPVHCYQRDRRDQVKKVMRYAGPRMLWEHPIMSLMHYVDGIKRSTESCRNSLKRTE
jgi:Nitrous oxide-stimulated promoter